MGENGQKHAEILENRVIQHELGICDVNYGYMWCELLEFGAETIISVLEKVKTFEIAVKQVEYEGCICWIRMCVALLLKALSEEINGILNHKHSIPYHQYDFDFKFHTLSFLDQDNEKVRNAYMKVKGQDCPKHLLQRDLQTVYHRQENLAHS